MILKDRIFTPGLAQVAYLVADTDAGECAVIDPRRDVQVYLDWAEEHGVRITAVLETHVHADFVSGGAHLAEVTGATLYTPRIGDVTYPHTPLDHGDEIQVGQAVLVAHHTPGHTPEHMAFLLRESAEDTPTALYSGDALFVGDVGRPDLLGEAETAGLASKLFHTVQERFKTLPDDVVVYPGHTAGSSCGKNIGSDPSTTIGREKSENYAFQHEEEEQFVESVLADMPTPPTYYPELKKVNRVSADQFVEGRDLPRLSAAEAKQKLAEGAKFFDMRSKEEFSAGFAEGARFAGTDGDFQTWMGWYAPFGSEIVLHIADGEDTESIRRSLAQIGLDSIAGVYVGDPADIGPVQRIPMASDDEALTRFENGEALLDVRNASERKELALEGTLAVPAGDVVQGAEIAGADPSDPLMTMCAGGYRSMVVASVLKDRGYTNVTSVAEGFQGSLKERAEREAN